MISLGELFSQSWAIYKKVFKRATALQFFPFLGLIPFVLILSVFAILSILKISGPAIGIISIVLGLLGLASILLLIFIGCIAQFGTYRLIANHQDQITIKQVLQEGKKNFWSYLGLVITVGVLTLLWTLLLFIPGLIMGIFYSMAIWLLVDQNMQGMAAVRQSKELVRGYWWPVFWRFILIFIIAGILSGIVDNIFKVQVTEKQTINYMGWLFNALTTPFFVSYYYLLYKSLRDLKNSSNITPTNPNANESK
ncbi:MAG: hypothetical protein C3F02_04020 [Parcubacteria group bacterium]|nr:MAG: hypothetical protein C3F02_04020 [Parcubacteria group bacterium]